MYTGMAVLKIALLAVQEADQRKEQACRRRRATWPQTYPLLPVPLTQASTIRTTAEATMHSAISQVSGFFRLT